MINRTRILTVSTDPALRRLMEQELADNDYEVVSTQQTGKSLKDVVDTENPDCIILDIMMPNLDGIGVCLALRQWTQVPIMMLSTWGAGDGMVRGLNLGSESYLTDPFGMDRLKMQVSETIKRNATAATDPMINTRIRTP